MAQHDPDLVIGVRSRTKDSKTGRGVPNSFFGKLTIIADGYASRFRKQLVSAMPITLSRFCALELRAAISRP